MKLTKRQLKRIIREEKRRLNEWGRPSDAMIRARNEEPDPMEAMRANQPKRDRERLRLVDDIYAVISIKVLGYQPEEGSVEFDEIYEAAEEILDLCGK